MKNLETAEAIKNINKTYNSKESNYKTGAPIVGNSLEQQVFASRNDINKIKELLSNSNLKLNLEHRKYLESFNNLFSEYSELNEQLGSIIKFYKDNLTTKSIKFTPENPFVFDEELNSMWKLSDDGKYFELKNPLELDDFEEVDFVFKIYNIGFTIIRSIKFTSYFLHQVGNNYTTEYYVNNEKRDSFVGTYNIEDYENDEIEFKLKIKFNTKFTKSDYFKIYTEFFKNNNESNINNLYFDGNNNFIFKSNENDRINKYFDIEIPEEDNNNFTINDNRITLTTGYTDADIDKEYYLQYSNYFRTGGYVSDPKNFNFDNDEKIIIPNGIYKFDLGVCGNNNNSGYDFYDEENDIFYLNRKHNNCRFFSPSNIFGYNNLYYFFKSKNFYKKSDSDVISIIDDDISIVRRYYDGNDDININNNYDSNVDYIILKEPKIKLISESSYFPNTSIKYNNRDIFNYFFDPLKLPDSITDNKIINQFNSGYIVQRYDSLIIRYYSKTNINSVKLYINDVEYSLINENTYTDILNRKVTKIKFDPIIDYTDNIKLEYIVNDATVKEPFYYSLDLICCNNEGRNINFFENLNRISKYIVSKDDKIEVAGRYVYTTFDNKELLNKSIGFRNYIDNENVFGIENNPLNNEETVIDGVKVSKDTTFEIEHRMRSIAFSILNRPNSSINITDQSEEIVENNFDTFENKVERGDIISKHIKNISMNLGRQNIPNQVKVTIDGLNENDENNNLSLKDFIIEYKENYTSLKIKNPKNYLGFNIKIEPRFYRINNNNYFYNDYYLFNVECNGNFNINYPYYGNNYSYPSFYMYSYESYYDNNGYQHNCANFNISQIDDNIDEITLNITHSHNGFNYTLSSLPIYYNDKNIKKILLKYKINCSDEIKNNQSENFNFNLNFETGQNISLPLDFDHLGETQEYELSLTNDYFGENGIGMMFNLTNDDWYNGNYNSNTDTFFLNIEDILFISDEEDTNNVFIKNEDVNIEEGDYYKLIDFNTNPCNKLEFSFFGNKESNNEIVKTRITSDQIRITEGYSDTLITDDNIEYGINIDENNNNQLSVDINIPEGNNKIDFEMKLPDGYNIFNSNSSSYYVDDYWNVEVYINDNDRPIILHNPVLLTNTWNKFSFDLDPSRTNKITIKLWSYNDLFDLINGNKIIRNIEYYNESVSVEDKIDLTTALVGEKSDKIVIAEDNNNALFYDLVEEENNENEEQEIEESDEEIIDVVSIKFMDNISFFMQSAALSNCEFYIDDEFINNIFKNKYVNNPGSNSESYNSESYNSESYNSESYNSENYNSGNLGFYRCFVPININVDDNKEHILTLKINRNGVLYGGSSSGSSNSESYNSESYNSESYNSESYNSENYNSEGSNSYVYDKTQNLIYDIYSNRSECKVLIFIDNELINKSYFTEFSTNFNIRFEDVKSRNVKLLLENKEDNYNISLSNIKYYNIPTITITDIYGSYKLFENNDIQYFEKSYDENLNRNININVSNINNGNFVYLFNSNISYKKFILLKNFDILNNEYNRYNFKNEIIDNENDIYKLSYKTLIDDNNIYLDYQTHLSPVKENRFNKPEDILNFNKDIFAKNIVNDKYKIFVKTFSITREFKSIYFKFKNICNYLILNITSSNGETTSYNLSDNYDYGDNYFSRHFGTNEYTVSFLMICNNYNKINSIYDIFYDNFIFDKGYSSEYIVTLNDFDNYFKTNSLSINSNFYSNNYLYNRYFMIKLNKRCRQIKLTENYYYINPKIFIDGKLNFISNENSGYIEINNLEDIDHEIIFLIDYYGTFSQLINYLTITCDDENINLQEIANNNSEIYDNFNINYEEEKILKENNNDNYIFYLYNETKYLSFIKNCNSLYFKCNIIKNCYFTVYVDGKRYNEWYFDRQSQFYNIEIELNEEKEHEFFIVISGGEVLLNEFTYSNGYYVEELSESNKLEAAEIISDNNLNNYNSGVSFFNNSSSFAKIITLKIKCINLEFYLRKINDDNNSFNNCLFYIDNERYGYSSYSSYDQRCNFNNLENKIHTFTWILIGKICISNISYENPDEAINQLKVDNEIIDIDGKNNIILDSTIEHDIEIIYSKNYFTYNKVLINNAEFRNIKFNFNNTYITFTQFVNSNNIFNNKNKINNNGNLILSNNEEFDFYNLDFDITNNDDNNYNRFRIDEYKMYTIKDEFNINLKLKEKFDLNKFFTYLSYSIYTYDERNKYSVLVDNNDSSPVKNKRNINIKFIKKNKDDNLYPMTSNDIFYLQSLYYNLTNLNIEQINTSSKKNIILKKLNSLENINENIIIDENMILNKLKNKFNNINITINENSRYLIAKKINKNDSNISTYKYDTSIQSTPFYNEDAGIKIVSLTKTCSSMSFKFKTSYSDWYYNSIILFIDGKFHRRYYWNNQWSEVVEITIEQGKHEFTWILYNRNAYRCIIDEITIDGKIITDYNEFNNYKSNYEIPLGSIPDDSNISTYKYDTSIQSTPFYNDKPGFKIVSITKACNTLSFKYKTRKIEYENFVFFYVDGKLNINLSTNNNWSTSSSYSFNYGIHEFTWVLYNSENYNCSCIDEITIDGKIITDYNEFSNNNETYKNKFEYVDDFNINKFSNHFEKINEENYNNFELSTKKNKIFKVSTIKYSQLEGLIKSPDIIDMVVSNENGDNVILTTKAKERMFKRDISNNEPNFSFVMKSDKNSIGSLKISNVKTEIDSQNMNEVISGINNFENSTREYNKSIDDISFGNDYEEVVNE